MVGPAFAGGLLDLDYGRVVLEVQAISEAMALVWREIDRIGRRLHRRREHPRTLRHFSRSATRFAPRT